MSTADAVAREAGWLAGPAQTAGTQTLPALLKSFGGPFDVVQAYLPRTPATRQTRLYVLRPRIQDTRFAQQRTMDTYDFRLRAFWPIGSGTITAQIAEIEQRNFDNAIDLVVARIRGLVADHTHGGAFLSAAEGPPNALIDVQFGDAEQEISAGTLSATISYSVDDRDQIG